MPLSRAHLGWHPTWERAGCLRQSWREEPRREATSPASPRRVSPWHLDQERGSVRMQAALWGSPWEAGWTDGQAEETGPQDARRPLSGARAQGGPPARAEGSQGDRAGLVHTGH